MSNFDNRSEPRRKVCVQAFASDTKETLNIKCIIRDVSDTGCLIITSQMHDLPGFIQLVPEGFDKPVNGKVIWRDDMKAGISFLAPSESDVLSILKDHYRKAFSEGDSDEPILLEARVQPLSYAERLANYAPPRK